MKRFRKMLAPFYLHRCSTDVLEVHFFGRVRSNFEVICVVNVTKLLYLLVRSDNSVLLIRCGCWAWFPYVSVSFGAITIFYTFVGY